MANDLSQYQAVRDRMMTGDWIGWKSNFTWEQKVGLPIRIWQRLRYGLKEPINHVSLLIRKEFEGDMRNFILESTVTDEFNGLRLRLLSERLQAFNGEVFWYSLRSDLCPIRLCLDNVLHDIIDRMEAAQIEYDSMGCLGNVFRRSPKSEANYYCSENGYMLLEEAARRFASDCPGSDALIIMDLFTKANQRLGGMAPMPGDAPELGIFNERKQIL